MFRYTVTMLASPAAFDLLADEDMSRFEEDGFLVVRNLISEPQVEELVVEYDKAGRGDYGYLSWDQRKNRRKSIEGKMGQLANPSQVIPGWSDHEYMQRSLAIARQLLGNDLEYQYDQLIMKPPYHPAETHWHQDAGYWKNNRAVTCWLALSEVVEINGAMRFLPGSHNKGIVEHMNASEYSEIDGALEAVVADISGAVTIPLEPGSATFHHCRTLHYASGNFSDVPRRGLITHFYPTE